MKDNSTLRDGWEELIGYLKEEEEGLLKYPAESRGVVYNDLLVIAEKAFYAGAYHALHLAMANSGILEIEGGQTVAVYSSKELVGVLGRIREMQLEVIATGEMMSKPTGMRVN